MALAEEANVPEREETVEWIFLSTDKTNDSEEVCGKLRWYTMRCGIEVYHRTSKGGRMIEER